MRRVDWDPEGELLAEVEREVYPDPAAIEDEWHGRVRGPERVKPVRVRTAHQRKPRRPRFLARCPHCETRSYGAHCGACGTALYLRAP